MLYDGERFTHEGMTFLFQIERDDDTGAPWENEDGHGPVSEWTMRDKRPGEMVLHGDGWSKRFYDFREAVAIAKRDGWDAPPYDVEGETKGQRAHKAAMADFRRLQQWCNDQWYWCGVIVTCDDLPGKPSASLWGIESDAREYFAEVATELAEQIIAEVAAEVERAIAQIARTLSDIDGQLTITAIQV